MERRYNFFSRMVGDGPSLVSFALIDDDEQQALPWAAVAYLEFRADENGLPTNAESERLYRVEDQLREFFTTIGAVHVGHSIGGGKLRAIFYAPSKGGDAVSVKSGLLKKTSIPIEWRHDPDWSLFNMELEPTEFESMLCRFRGLWAKLLELGDNPTLPREVDFSSDFRAEEDCERFKTEVAENGFGIRESPSGSVVAYKYISVEPEVIVPECLYLEETAKRHRGEFDGWACSVTN